MRFTRTLLASIAVCALAATATPCSAKVDSKDNAALHYWPAWARLKEPDAEKMYDMFSAKHDGDNSWIGTKETDEWLERTTDALELLIEASLFQHADFGLDYSKGIETRVHHLGHFQQSWQGLDVRSHIAHRQGDTDRVVEFAATALRMSEHVVDDQILICSLVSISIFKPTVERLEERADIGALTAEQKRTIQTALDRFDVIDPFGVRACIIGERDLVADWLERELLKLAPAQRIPFLHKLISIDGTNTDHDSPLAVKMEQIVQTDEGVLKELRLYRLLFDQIYLAWDQEDAMDALETLAQGVGDGAFGTFALVMAPSITRAHKNDFEAQAMLTRLRELVAE